MNCQLPASSGGEEYGPGTNVCAVEVWQGPSAKEAEMASTGSATSQTWLCGT